MFKTIDLAILEAASFPDRAMAGCLPDPGSRGQPVSCLLSHPLLGAPRHACSCWARHHFSLDSSVLSEIPLITMGNLVLTVRFSAGEVLRRVLTI